MYFFSVYLIHDTVDTVECLQKKMCSLWNWFIKLCFKNITFIRQSVEVILFLLF